MPQAANAGLSIIALIAACPALAATLEATSRIDSVTIYPDAAQISRIAEVEIPAGATSIVFKGLPMALDPASLRVEGAGGAAIQIGSVEARVAPVQQIPPDGSLGEALRKLNAERAVTQARIAALDAKKAMIERYSQASPEKLGEKDAPLDIGKWTAAWDAVGQGLAKLAEESQTVRQKLADIEQEIRALQVSNRPNTQRSQPSRDIAVDVEAQGAAKARFVLTYRVSNAGWRPLYDARLESKGAEKPMLQLVRRAQISQRTGEDWTSAEISVSTVRTQRGTRAPDVLTQRIKFFEPPVVVQRPRAAASSNVGGRADMLSGAVAPAAPAPMSEEVRQEAAKESEATMEAGA